MDGAMAPLAGICALAERYEALVLVDDSHATGFVGPGGRGTHEQAGVMGRVDVLTGTLGKALGGASGGYVSGRREIIEFLRQRSRPYLFSNTVPPAVVAGALKAIELVEREPALRAHLWENTRYFRGRIASLGFTVTPGDHPIIPIMIGDAALAHRMAARLLEKGIYVVGFAYPVVPRGKARIRVQMSAALSREELDFALRAFADVKAELGV
jgi:glycine C-acetyltransferase